MSSLSRIIRKMSYPALFAIIVAVFTIVVMFKMHERRIYMAFENRMASLEPLIIVVTPTYKRPTRLADMTRFANTLRLISHIHWIVVEDGNQTVRYVENILRRSTHPYTYFAAKSPKGYPKSGWYQRTKALQFLRNETESVIGKHKEGVVYFGDDDNSYDTRLFSDYIRNVKKIGMWAVGIVGGAPVESPKVVNGMVVGYRVKWRPNRKFAVDMAGFAINLKVILRTTAVFEKSCIRGYGAPEPCFLENMGFDQDDIEPFGFSEDVGEIEHEILVWHTKTVQPKFDNDTLFYAYGFSIEI